MSTETSVILTGNRALKDPTAREGELFFVAAPTYAADSGSNVPEQVLETPEGRCLALTLDSNGSEANRAEDRLHGLFEVEHPELPYPRISIPFHLKNGMVFDVTNWHMCHRSADKTYRLTDYYDEPSRRLQSRPAFVNPYDDLTYFVEHFPIDVVLGVWHANLGPLLKMPRLLSGTITAYTPVATTDHDPSNRMTKGATKRDPLVTGSAKAISEDTPNGAFPSTLKKFDFTAKLNKDDKEGISSVGLGDIVTSLALGSTFAVKSVEQRVSLALAPIQNAHFRTKDGKIEPDRDAAGREYLIALAMIAFRSMLEIGGLLRSGCLLSPVAGSTSIKSVQRDGTESDFTLPSMDDLVKAYSHAANAAIKKGFSFDNVTANPNDNLKELVEKLGKHTDRAKSEKVKAT